MRKRSVKVMANFSAVISDKEWILNSAVDLCQN